MKYTTARRLIKEHKKGLKTHSAPLLEKAHAVCQLYHSKLDAEEKFKAAIATETLKYSQAKGIALEVLTGGIDIKEFAQRQVKIARNGSTNDRKLREGRRFLLKDVEPMGNKPIGDNISNHEKLSGLRTASGPIEIEVK